MLKDKAVRRKGKQGKPLAKIDIATVAIKEGDDIVYENNYRAVYFLGVLIWRKRLRMSIYKDGTKSVGF